jgi:hypothetical protein
VSYDRAVLADPAAEDHSSLNFYCNAATCLLDTLATDARFAKSSLVDASRRALEYWQTAAARRPEQKAVDAAMDIHVLGTVGAVLFRAGGLSDQQLCKELTRLAESDQGLLANYYLFYLASTLWRAGYNVRFVPEESAQTPDLEATKDGRTVFVEATVKEPKRPPTTSAEVDNLFKDVLEVKRQKFTDPRFFPGMIALDATPIGDTVAAGGRGVKLREHLLEKEPSGQEWYPVYLDADFLKWPENSDSIVGHAVRQFSFIDPAKYHVTQCLVTRVRATVVGEDSVSFPKEHLLLVRRGDESTVLRELATKVYVVEQKPPDA